MQATPRPKKRSESHCRGVYRRPSITTAQSAVTSDYIECSVLSVEAMVPADAYLELEGDLEDSHAQISGCDVTAEGKC